MFNAYPTADAVLQHLLENVQAISAKTYRTHIVLARLYDENKGCTELSSADLGLALGMSSRTAQRYRYEIEASGLWTMETRIKRSGNTTAYFPTMNIEGSK